MSDVTRIERLSALEILDSRGRPTLQVTCVLQDGMRATASVPSGASRGRAEAAELRDRDSNRYGGQGCLQAVRRVEQDIQDAVAGRPFRHQQELDDWLVQLDGTAGKTRLGGNTLLAVSLAFARARARAKQLPLYLGFAQNSAETPGRIPRPMINLFSGGAHAGSQVAIQDVMLVPGSPTLSEALAQTWEVYRSAQERTRQRFGSRPLVADEGGLAPPFEHSQAMLEEAVESIRAAGLVPGKEMFLAVDLAASQFFRYGRYQLDQESLEAPALIERVAAWTAIFPIVSLEDPLAEEAWDDWVILRKRLPESVRLIGDDLLCTNPARIERARSLGACDALLLKVNQIGTLSEAARSLQAARAARWQITTSARSGETEDCWLADLAVGWSTDRIKIGSITRSERLSKYNRLLAIEKETRWPLAEL